MKVWLAMLFLLSFSPSFVLNAMGTDNDVDDECPICYVPLSGLVAAPGCGGTEGLHKFHQGCLDGWMAREQQKDHDKCPQCKTTIPKDLLFEYFGVALGDAGAYGPPAPPRTRRRGVKSKILDALCPCMRRIEDN